MSVLIKLDDNKGSYTNLDSISGRILLNLGHDESVSAVVVKLEGESRSAIERAQGSGHHPTNSLVTKNDQRAGFQRQGIATEKHKILYEVSQVFPNQNSTAKGGNTTDPVYTLRAGQHEYPFKFKIPLENGCSHLPSRETRPNHDSGTFWETEGRPPLPSRHVKRVLPPSLAGLAIQAEIRYYIKVTVHRPSRFKGNKRSEHPFRFIPLDPPRKLTSSKEVYARRPYSFQNGPSGEVDARLPSPPVLTWDQHIPLRIILRKSEENEEQLYLAFLQLRLFDFTEIRASDVIRVRTNARKLLSLDGLAIPVWNPSEIEKMLDSTLWDRLLLPSTVEPSFETCNLRRTYDLEVGIGLGYRGAQNAQVCLRHISILSCERSF
jgi:Arrestin (or S-antigen), N-terminal domain